MEQSRSKLIPVLFFILTGFFVMTGIQALAAWTDPSCPPPGCNSAPPINVGPNPQTKIGDLGVAGDLIVGTNLGIGTVSPTARLDVRGDLLTLATTTLATNPVSIAQVGDGSTAIVNTAGKMRVFGPLTVWGSGQTSNFYGDIRTASDGKYSSFDVIKGTVQGDLRLLPAGNRDGGNVLIKPNSDSGSVVVGSGGLVNLDVQGNINISQRFVPSSYYYTKGIETSTNITIAHNQTPNLSQWPSSMRLNQMSCDLTLNEEIDECPDSSYSASASSPVKAYNLYILGTTLTGGQCPPPPNGNSQCTYRLGGREFTRGSVPSTAQGGRINGLQGNFSELISAPWYCPEGGSPSSFNCLWFGGNGTIVTPPKFIVGGLESGSALAGGPENLFVNALNGTTTARIGLETDANGKRVGLYSYKRSPTSNVFGLVASDLPVGASPDAWFLNDIGTGNWGLNAVPNNTHTLNVSGKLNATELCISGVCQSSWPTGGGPGNPGSPDWDRNGNDLTTASGIINVGIGVANPAKKLDVNGTIRFGAHLVGNDASGAFVLNAGPSSQGSASGFWFRSNNVLGNETSGSGFTNLMRITAVGDVGIGTVTPQQKLDVTGNIKASGNIHATRYCDENGGNCFTPASVNTGGGGSGSLAYSQNNARSVSGAFLNNPYLDINGLVSGRKYMVSVYGGTNDPGVALPRIRITDCNNSATTYNGQSLQTGSFSVNWPDGWMPMSHTFVFTAGSNSCARASIAPTSGGPREGVDSITVVQLD